MTLQTFRVFELSDDEMQIDDFNKRLKVHSSEPGRYYSYNLRHKVKVFVRVVFLKVGEINTLKEKYSAEIYIQAKWEKQEKQNTQSWKPNLYIENLMGEAKEDRWFKTITAECGKTFDYECHRIKGVFIENLELEHFPFDTQELSLTITSERKDNEVELYEDEEDVSCINKQSFVDEQEWSLYEHVEIFPRVTEKQFTSSKEKHPSLLVMCHASRRPGFFVWNMFLVMFLITILSFSTFSVEIFRPQNRLQLSFTLVLTGVAFKFVVNQSLPRISYLTYLDKYILSSMIYLVFVCMWHSIICKINIPNSSDVDWKALTVFAGLYVLFHALFTLWIYNNAWGRRRLMIVKDKEYKARLLRLQKMNSQKITVDDMTSLKSGMLSS